jgi:hypothetical protein
MPRTPLGAGRLPPLPIPPKFASSNHRVRVVTTRRSRPVRLPVQRRLPGRVLRDQRSIRPAVAITAASRIRAAGGSYHRLGNGVVIEIGHEVRVPPARRYFALG